MRKKTRKLPFARSRTSLLFMVVSVMILLLIWSGGGIYDREQGEVLKRGLDSEEIRRAGLALYNGHCLSCHGIEGRGTDRGPALVHPLYGLENLSDQAFTQAVFYGAPQRHFRFGPMEAIKALKQVEIAQILAYVRAVQKDAKIP